MNRRHKNWEGTQMGLDKIEDLLVNKGLYDSCDISIDDLDEIEKRLSKSEYTNNTVDCFCIKCGVNRIFEFSNCEVYEETGMIRYALDSEGGRTRKPKREEVFGGYLNRRYVLTYRCTRDRQHALLFDLITTENKIIKIGQFPSVADIITPDLIKYKSILGKQYHEYSKAIGLFAHGIGIGSFVYLRRIIENLVFDKFKEHLGELSIKEDDFNYLKFDQKIDAIKDYLPSTLVTNKNVYGIVSKGIHELSEDECRRLFPFVKAGIELILDPKFHVCFLLASKITISRRI